MSLQTWFKNLATSEKTKAIAQAAAEAAVVEGFDLELEDGREAAAPTPRAPASSSSASGLPDWLPWAGLGVGVLGLIVAVGRRS